MSSCRILKKDGIHRAHDFTSAYLDYLMIDITTWEDHLCNLHTLLLHLCKANLTAKPCKYQCGMYHCAYLGFTAGGGVLRQEICKLQAIQQLLVLNVKCDMRAFLGILGYHRKFILDYTNIVVCRLT